MKYILIILFCFNVSATEFRLTDKSSKSSLVLELDDRWLYLENVLGVPHLFISKTDKPKDSISVTPTNLKKLKLNPNQLKDNQKDYQIGRKKWIEEKKAKLLKFHDYKFYGAQKPIRIHQIGFDYKINMNNFTEYSYYLECKSNFYHIKSTILKTRSQYNQEVLEAIKSTRCTN